MNKCHVGLDGWTRAATEVQKPHAPPAPPGPIVFFSHVSLPQAVKSLVGPPGKTSGPLELVSTKKTRRKKKGKIFPALMIGTIWKNKQTKPKTKQQKAPQNKETNPKKQNKTNKKTNPTINLKATTTKQTEIKCLSIPSLLDRRKSN